MNLSGHSHLLRQSTVKYFSPHPTPIPEVASSVQSLAIFYSLPMHTTRSVTAFGQPTFACIMVNIQPPLGEVAQAQFISSVNDELRVIIYGEKV